MNELSDVLSLIANVSWFVDLVSLLLFAAIAKRCKAINSSLVTVIVIQVAGSLMLSYEGFLNGYISAHPGFNPVVNFFWYTGFALFDWLAIRSLRWSHQLVKVHLGALAKYATVAFAAAGLLQIVMYLEIVIFKSEDTLAQVYTIGVPAIQVSMTLVCLGLALYSVYVVFIKNTRPETLRWNI